MFHGPAAAWARIAESDSACGPGDGMGKVFAHDQRRSGAPRVGVGARLRNYFLAGILATAPLCLTAYIAWRFITWVDEGVFSLLPPECNPETYLPFSIP